MLRQQRVIVDAQRDRVAVPLHADRCARTVGRRTGVHRRIVELDAAVVEQMRLRAHDPAGGHRDALPRDHVALAVEVRPNGATRRRIQIVPVHGDLRAAGLRQAQVGRRHRAGVDANASVRPDPDRVHLVTVEREHEAARKLDRDDVVVAEREPGPRDQRIEVASRLLDVACAVEVGGVASEHGIDAQRLFDARRKHVEARADLEHVLARAEVDARVPAAAGDVERDAADVRDHLAIGEHEARRVEQRVRGDRRLARGGLEPDLGLDRAAVRTCPGSGAQIHERLAEVTQREGGPRTTAARTQAIAALRPDVVDRHRRRRRDDRRKRRLARLGARARDSDVLADRGHAVVRDPEDHVVPRSRVARARRRHDVQVRRGVRGDVELDEALLLIKLVRRGRELDHRDAFDDLFIVLTAGQPERALVGGHDANAVDDDLRFGVHFDLGPQTPEQVRRREHPVVVVRLRVVVHTPRTEVHASVGQQERLRVVAPVGPRRPGHSAW